jgi:DNA-binding transcriptional ArsR family regulator
MKRNRPSQVLKKEKKSNPTKRGPSAHKGGAWVSESLREQELARLRRQSAEVAGLLKILAHPQRLLILCALIEGEKNVGEIEQQCGASQSAVSQFLKSMRLSGLLESRTQGQHRIYRISDERVLSIVRSLHSIFCA